MLTSRQMGNEDIGKHLQSIGNLPGAHEAFTRMRSDVMMAKHNADISKHLIEVAIEQKQWQFVRPNVSKMRSIQTGAADDDLNQQYLQAAEGLACMEAAEYASAAQCFLATEAGMGASCNRIISPNDVAVYGGICALATMSRAELQSQVLDNVGFRTYLELEPHIRRAISFFVNSRSTACLGVLESYRTDYLLDLHLHKHVDALYTMVRNKSIQQYFIPFSCVTLDSLNQAFAAPGKTVEKELIRMIQKGELDAQIDLINKVSYGDWISDVMLIPIPR